MDSKREAGVACLWQEHLEAEFPARRRGAELAGIDMVWMRTSPDA
ncbi:hypothetical protein ACFRCW_37160 [Streptomyces sp. NPDC056653]